MGTKYKYNTLEDFLISHPLNVDIEADDGWGAKFPVKGIEIEATVLFADITGFSKRTLDMSPTEILIFVNNFFSWITAEAIKDSPCIVDKYIGDEVMLLFSKEFGSEDPFEDAIRSARWMVENDFLAFCPHIGVASGDVTAGYVGTPIKYNASLFGKPVNIAARCASVSPLEGSHPSITFPEAEWGDRKLENVLPALKRKDREGNIYEEPLCWAINEPRQVEIKNMGKILIRELEQQTIIFPGQRAEDRAKELFQSILKGGWYRKPARNAKNI